LFLKGGHQILNDKEKQVAEILKQQIIYDIVVELSTICNGIGGNSLLKDEERHTVDLNINSNNTNPNINYSNVNPNSDTIDEMPHNGLNTTAIGLHQSILPNQRTAKMQQQSMDLFYCIGDATVIEFFDPRSDEKLENLDAKIENCY
ncbi:5214_t:CDS:2, partial [Racocetra fulgida]